MAEEETKAAVETPEAPEPAAPPKRVARARRAPAAKTEAPTPRAEEPESPAKPEPVAVPRRAKLPVETMRLLSLRRTTDRRRPIFGRQAENRYYRIGRDDAWRRPRGLQSKQRRHYGYRAKIVRVGYRSPAKVRGLVPSGFKPVLVRTSRDLNGIDGDHEAAVIARTVGTRRRLVLEEEARKLGIRVLNPIVKAETEA
jgi:large subunit ribosomal protein L32e